MSEIRHSSLGRVRHDGQEMARPLHVITAQEANQYNRASDVERTAMERQLAATHRYTPTHARGLYQRAVMRLFRRIREQTPRLTQSELLVFRTGEAHERNHVLHAYAHQHNTDYTTALMRFTEAARIQRKLDGDKPLAMMAQVHAHPEPHDPRCEARARAALDKLPV